MMERIQKFNNEELGSKKTFYRHTFKIKHIWMLAGLIILNIFSLNGYTVLCCNVSDDQALQNLILRNNSEALESFKKPTMGSYYGVHIFNYTNVEDFKNGQASKLHVEDVGPYVFQESIERVNVTMHDNGTISFQEKRSYIFSPEMSNGTILSDMVVVPNLPMLGSILTVKNEYILTRFALSSLLTTLNAKVFLKLPVHQFILGYEDEYFSITKNNLLLNKKIPFDKIGLLVPKNGTSLDRITINTGENNLNNIGKIVLFNEEDRMNHWSTDDCNSINGTLGSFFSPYDIKCKQPIDVYHKDLCRKLTLEFEQEVQLINSQTAYRYVPSLDSFDYPDKEHKNQCYCNAEAEGCPPKGIINASPCAYGPTYISLPHFLNGDEHLLENVTGLNPNKEKHGSFLNIHPSFGHTIGGSIRFQLNMLVRKVFGISQINMFEDNTMLPVAWFDSDINTVKLSETVVKYVENGPVSQELNSSQNMG